MRLAASLRHCSWIAFTLFAGLALVEVPLNTGGASGTAIGAAMTADAAQGRGRGRGTESGTAPDVEIPVEPKAPPSVKEGEIWIPPLPSMDAVKPPAGWTPSGHEAPPMPLTLLRLPRTNITRAKYPAIDFHVHAGGLTTPEAYQQLIRLMDTIGMGAIVNLNGGTGANLDKVLNAGQPHRDRVANFITFSAEGINEPGWSEKFAAEMERAFKAGAAGMKVSKQLGQGTRNPDGTFIQADDPRLDPIWAMAARYNRPVMIHTSDSIGRFYPIGPKNERYEAGLWRKPGDTSGNLYLDGPRHEVIEKARENMHRKHPKTRFVNAHLAMLYYDPQKLATFLDTYPNADVEISATVQDLGRAPRFWREFIIKYQDRVFMGSDGNPNRQPDEFWTPHWRYLETYDEYFYHPAQIRTPGGSPGHGRWNISGIGLPDAVLRKVYYENGLRHLPSLRPSIERQIAARK
jgi:predicted TIM-barrel fold metal-dependent hydrolase